MIGVDDVETVCHQLAAESLPLHWRNDAKPRQVPVRVRGMGGVHLFENGEGVTVLVRRHRLSEQGTNRVAVRCHFGWQPEGDGREVAQAPYGPGIERGATKGRQEPWEVCEVQ